MIHILLIGNQENTNTELKIMDKEINHKINNIINYLIKQNLILLGLIIIFTSCESKYYSYEVDTKKYPAYRVRELRKWKNSQKKYYLYSHDIYHGYTPLAAFIFKNYEDKEVAKENDKYVGESILIRSYNVGEDTVVSTYVIGSDTIVQTTKRIKGFTLDPRTPYYIISDTEDPEVIEVITFGWREQTRGFNNSLFNHGYTERKYLRENPPDFGSWRVPSKGWEGED
ncbi:hypothetical protein [Hugenholtzia roseola]|uniref:hypothetical protein n=1 Tax=Hugenholtzia roseola TaxID=1002 RepID=UPI000429A1AA|nr:hypothetical protein [Hugenholtzia roseola]